MATVRDTVSRVRSKHRLLSQDAQISDRAIAAELRSKAILLIKRETNLRRLWNSPNLFTTIECLEMEPASISECCEYNGHKKISRSVHKLPRISEGLFGLIIQGVYNIEGTKKLIEVTPNRYVTILKMDLPERNTYYWLANDRLYVSKSPIELVKVVAFFEEDITQELKQKDCECTGKNEAADDCTNPLDEQFKCPAYLVDAAVTMASQELLNSYFRIPKDKSSNQIDEQTQ